MIFACAVLASVVTLHAWRTKQTLELPQIHPVDANKSEPKATEMRDDSESLSDGTHRPEGLIRLSQASNAGKVATVDGNAKEDWFPGGGFGDGGGFGTGFGCGVYVPTFASECYYPETGQGSVICVAHGSSVFTPSGHWGNYHASLAVDGQLSPGNTGFFHSNFERQPSLRIQLRTFDNREFVEREISRVEIYSRCDGFQSVGLVTLEVRVSTAESQVIPAHGGLTGGKICGRNGRHNGELIQSSKEVVVCPDRPKGYEVWIQKIDPHSGGSGWGSHGGWPGDNHGWSDYTANDPSQNPANGKEGTALMINEVVIY